ncbi:MAG: hypothetical protein ACLP2P_17065 [Desulfobaccales bacterium]
MAGFWGKVLRVGLLSFLLVTLNWRAGLAADPAISRNEPGSVAEKTDTPKEDDRLPIQKEGWQFFLAPYLWIPGFHLDLSHQGKFSGTTVADVPWYELVPLLFSKVIGGMGRVEIWNGRWGVFSDTNFMYIGDSISGGGAKTLELNSKQLPATIPVNLQLSGDLKIWTRLFWQDVGVRYLVGTVPLQADKPLPVVSFELLGGLRYAHLNQATSLGLNATLTGPLGQVQISRGGSFFSDLQLSIIEPLVGMRIGVWFTPKLNLLVKADCGGFGLVAYNNVDSVLEGLIGYQVHKNIRLYAGYRARYFSGSDTSKDIAVHGWFHGPLLGTVFSF